MLTVVIGTYVYGILVIDGRYGPKTIISLFIHVAPFVPPPTVCQRDDGVPATGCVNPSLPLTGNCTCPDSFVMITFDEGQWKPNPPCGGWYGHVMTYM